MMLGGVIVLTYISGCWGIMNMFYTSKPIGAAEKIFYHMCRITLIAGTCMVIYYIAYIDFYLETYKRLTYVE